MANKFSPHDFRPPADEPLHYKCTFSGTICDAMKRRGWQPHDSINKWSIFFADMSQFRAFYYASTHQLCGPLKPYQKIGHFRSCQEISRKNLLVRNLKRLRYRLERSFGREVGDKCDFLPETFVLPSEHHKFLDKYRSEPNSLWILKPSAGAQGRGIFIFKSINDYLSWRTTFVEIPEEANQPQAQTTASSSNPPTTPNSNTTNQDTQTGATNTSNSNPNPQQENPATSPRPVPDTFVVQRYIADPYLIGGRKFDIRFYVLVTSYNPLTCYVYREGFARFSAGQFSLDALQDVYIHLTNVAIQKTSEDYNPEKGSKWSIQSLREYLTARHGREKVLELFNTIDMIVIRTLQAAVGLVVSDSHCFEVYGFDVLIDRSLRPWLLEVNASPSFTPSNEEDYRLKIAVCDDTASVLDLEQRLTGMEKRIGGYDLMFHEGSPVYANPADCGHAKGWEGGPKLNSYLGCRNDRVPQLRDLYRTAHFVKSTSVLLGEKDKDEAEFVQDNSSHDVRFLLPD